VCLILHLISFHSKGIKKNPFHSFNSSLLGSIVRKNEKPEVTASGFREELRQITGSSTKQVPIYSIFRLISRPEEIHPTADKDTMPLV